MPPTPATRLQQLQLVPLLLLVVLGLLLPACADPEQIHISVATQTFLPPPSSAPSPPSPPPPPSANRLLLSWVDAAPSSSDAGCTGGADATASYTTMAELQAMPTTPAAAGYPRVEVWVGAEPPAPSSPALFVVCGRPKTAPAVPGSTAPNNVLLGDLSARAAFEAQLPALPTGLAVHYRVSASSAAGGASAIFSTAQPPTALPAAAAGEDTESDFTLAVVSDIGRFWTAPFVMHALQELGAAGRIQAMVTAGDISYANGDYAHWDAYMQGMQPVYAQVPLQLAPGNHEDEVIGGLDAGFAAYELRFPTATQAAASGSPSPFFYSFDLAGIHFVSLSTEHVFDADSAQYQWLRRDLEAAHARRQRQPERFPFIIAFHHRSMYSSTVPLDAQHVGNHGSDLPFRAAIEPLYVEFAVDVVLSGHDHVYERSFRCANGQRNDNGPAHWQIGTGGHNIHPTFSPVQPPTTANRQTTTGFGLIRVRARERRLDFAFHSIDTSPCASDDKYCSDGLFASSAQGLSAPLHALDRATVTDTFTAQARSFPGADLDGPQRTSGGFPFQATIVLVLFAVVASAAIIYTIWFRRTQPNRARPYQALPTDDEFRPGEVQALIGSKDDDYWSDSESEEWGAGAERSAAAAAGAGDEAAAGGGDGSGDGDGDLARALALPPIGPDDEYDEPEFASSTPVSTEFSV